ncbi:hypothetical protein DIZ81_03590 [Legionella taurinensis]|uniref:F-box domain-containing protein n=1 Tax=Legionella taurinensis TaxID=70611 RepID=A0A3A5L575_9GAMM|nr:hypothetical protein [Legionella taurinensis]MDX1836747.1 hypothetical protein [Legionella taurinensis]PUT41170.1 hypothetical protein DB744_03590 [Legionella taurinensis]PUT42295.1 hypothetical protein DB746_07520 [Legionella taurinensis]PUT43820.1 hypothetical protein DB743_09470 [Legionella taurinensis]PUT47076.1 hypothetical protein DB745_08600 [Legionella taurinensis]
MKLNQSDIIPCNRLTRWSNNEARYNSKEEKAYTLGAAGGMFMMWRPYAASENSSLPAEDNPGLPREVGALIGDYLNRGDAAKMAETCKKANSMAKQMHKEYIDKNGKSYDEIPYLAFI